jgi:hypothetical protein
MSVGDNFTLLPLSKYFVKRTTEPGPQTNIGSIYPIASGRIENDAINRTGDVTGNYTWYRLSHFEGTPNTQGRELREYLLVCRDVRANANSCSFSLPIPDGGFNPNYMSFKLLYNSMTITNPGAPASNTWNFNISGTNFDYVDIATNTSLFNPYMQRFFLYIMGI